MIMEKRGLKWKPQSQTGKSLFDFWFGVKARAILKTKFEPTMTEKATPSCLCDVCHSKKTNNVLYKHRLAAMKLERPLTMKSGVALESNYSVHHRSDILMEEQVNTVKKSQEDLKHALAALETTKSEEDLSKCRSDVQEAREKSEKDIMILQILTKVNTELSFARADLDEALEKQEGDINEARKRVMWLEDRMGVLCGKARLRGQTFQKPKKSHRSPDTSLFRSRLSSTSEKSSEDDYATQRMGRNGSIGYKSDIIQRGRDYSPSESGSEYQPFPQQSRPGIADTPSSGGDFYMAQQQAGAVHRGLDDSESDDDDAMPPPLNVPPGLSMQTMPHMVGPPGVKPGSPGSESEEESQQGYEATTTEYSEPQSAYRYEDETETKPSHAGEQDDEDDEETESYDQRQTDEQTDSGIHTEQALVKKPLEIIKIGQEEESESEPEEEGEEDRDRSEASSRSESEPSSVSAMQAQQGKEPLFMTEVSLAKSVTIQAPKRPVHKQDTDLSKVERELTQEDEMEEDFSRDYWHSEHHRFEYSEYSEVLCDLDPLSYHSVGLAIPGSFINKPEKAFSDLPWRSRRKGSDINDIHRIALDKLAGRVHTMYDKVYDAALLSVRPSVAMEGRRETTMMSNFDATRDGARSGTPTDSRPGMITAPPTTAEGHSRPHTVSTVVVPLRVGLNVYHPKPIPPPEMLPLTRISQDKVYPRLSNQFVETDDILSHKPAVRIADQRNLYKETKLKLYRERPKKADKDTSSMEKKFRMMLEQEKSLASRISTSSRQTSPNSTRSSTAKNTTNPIRTVSASSSFSKSVSVMGKGAGETRMSMARTLTKASTWSRLKPSSRGKEYGGLKWERVKTIVHSNLVSRQPEERRDAAKHLGLLRCGDAMVFYALKDRLRVDDDARTRYEAAKSLVLLGCWDEDVIQVILKYLVLGNTEIRQDLIRTMSDGRNVQYVNKKTPSFPELVKVLSHFCCNPDPEDINAFDAAVLLGKLCVSDENAKFKLLRALNQTNDTHLKAKALETLVKQLNCTSWDVVEHLLDLFKESSVWRYRALAADLLIVLGKEHVCKRGEEEKIYLILERKLWDDPTRDVRVSAAKALAALGMFSKACDRIEKRLEDTDEDIRAQAVISVGTLEMKNEKIIRLLLEMLELDSSEYVRLMIARTFTQLKMTDKRVMRALRERDKVDGPLARESRKALKVLESLVSQNRLSTPIGLKSMGSRGTPRGMTPYTPAAIA